MLPVNPATPRAEVALEVMACTVLAVVFASAAIPSDWRLAMVVPMTDPMAAVFVASDPKVDSASTDLPTTLAAAADLSARFRLDDVASEAMVPVIIL